MVRGAGRHLRRVPAGAEGSLCPQVFEGRPADLPGLLVVHKCRPARGGGGLFLRPGLAGPGLWPAGMGVPRWRCPPAPIPSLYTYGQNSPGYLEVMSACHQRAADALVAGAISNGGLYVKLGQGLCSFNHLLPPEYIKTLRVLEDRALTQGFREVSPSRGSAEAGSGRTLLQATPPPRPPPHPPVLPGGRAVPRRLPGPAPRALPGV